MKKNNKKLKSFLILLLILTMLIAGTYALELYSTATISAYPVTSGARIHDDYDGTDKNIYIENYGDEGGEAVFARIRLLEYMEIGTGAGSGSGSVTVLTGDVSPTGGNSTPVLSNEDSWYYHKYHGAYTDTENDLSKIRHYKDLELGGRTIYMPTFNRNNQSTDSETNGTWAGQSGTAFDDFRYYVLGETKTATMTYYDTASSTTKTATQTHTAKVTAFAEIMFMEEWEALSYEEKIGPYWVYDKEDSWFYWAQPIEPQSATGLLVDSVNHLVTMDVDWYYAAYAVAQTATAGDWGEKSSSTGMYEDGISDSGYKLLTLISDTYTVSKVDITVENDIQEISGDLHLHIQDNLDLSAAVTLLDGLGYEREQEILWSIEEIKVGTGSGLDTAYLNTRIADGYLSPVGDMSGHSYLITAASAIDPSVYDTITVHIYDARYDYFNNISVVFQGEECKLGYLNTEAAQVTATVSGATSSGTYINSAGNLVVGADETVGNTLTLTMTPVLIDGTAATRTVKVLTSLTAFASDSAKIRAAHGTTNTVALDYYNYYVLDIKQQDGHDIALLYSQDLLFRYRYNSATLNTWETSEMRLTTLPAWLEGEDGYSGVKAGDKIKTYAAEVENITFSTTRTEYNTDKAFILSADEYRRYVLSDETDTIKKAGNTVSATLHWTRTPPNATTTVAVIMATLTNANLGNITTTNSTTTTTVGVRPAVWVYLTPES